LESRHAGKEGEIGDGYVHVEGGESVEHARKAVLGPESFDWRVVIHAAQDDSCIVFEAEFAP
jgi:hypothetical protein